MNNIKKGQPKMCVQLNDSEVVMLIDTGSSINVIDEKTFKNCMCDFTFLSFSVNSQLCVSCRNLV